MCYPPLSPRSISINKSQTRCLQILSIFSNLIVYYFRHKIIWCTPVITSSNALYLSYSLVGSPTRSRYRSCELLLSLSTHFTLPLYVTFSSTSPKTFLIHPHPSSFICLSFSSNVAYCDSRSLSCLDFLQLLSLSLPLVLPSPPSPVHSSPPALSPSLTPAFQPLLFSLFCRLSLSLNCCPSLYLSHYQPLSPVFHLIPSLPIFLFIPHLIFLCLTMSPHVHISAPLYFSIYTPLSILSFWVIL